jgi:hypothetical protein
VYLFGYTVFKYYQGLTRGTDFVLRKGMEKYPDDWHDVGRFPATCAFLSDDDLGLWFWTYKVWQGSTSHLLILGNNSWTRWFYTTGANPKWSEAKCKLESITI